MSGGTKSPTKGGAGKARLTELPLLDEVNELIEKERLLLKLKVLEQQKEAQEWKAKYDVLAGKVSETSLRTGDFRAMEVLAATTVDATADSKVGMLTAGSVAATAPGFGLTSSAAVASSIPATPEGVQSFLSSLKHDWVLDMSYKSGVRSALLSQINDAALSLRAPTSVKIGLFSHCGMTDEVSAALGVTVGRPCIEALDLSFNDLGSGSLQQINSGLRTRRRTPQYLLLHGNPILSTAALPVSSTLSLLTDSTWGVSVSVPDLSHGQLSGGAAGAAAGKKKPPVSVSASGGSRDAKDKDNENKDAKGVGSKASRGASIAELYDTANHPMQALAFLEALHLTLDPSAADSKGGKSNKAAAKKVPTKKDKESKDKEKDEKSGVLRSSKITALSTLGLTHAHLSMQSVAKLAVLLPILAPSLTDLDLSFSYVGLHGASHLATALEHRRCSLVRLGLPGNNLGDLGASVLAKGLRKNNSLTSLDLRSNNISPVGLRSLCAALASSRRCVVSHIDLRGNPIPHAALLSAVSELRDVGSAVQLRYGPSLPSDCSLNTTTTSTAATSNRPSSSQGVAPVDAIPKSSQLLWQQPHSAAHPLDPTVGPAPTANLYSIDLRFANAHYGTHPNHSLALEWSMRPQLPSSSSSSTSSSSGSGSGSAATAPPLRWEVRLYSPTTDRVLAAGTLAPTSCLGGTWARVRVLVSDLPSKGSLEISARPWSGGGGGGEGSESSASSSSAWGSGSVPGGLLGVEACQCLLYSVSPSEALVVGGDCAQWSDAENASLSLGCAAAGLGGDVLAAAVAAIDAAGNESSAAIGAAALGSWQVPSGFKVLRCLKVTEASGRISSVSWESRLHASGGSAGNATFGYEWMVLLGRCQQSSCSVLTRGVCFAQNTSSASAVLQPWTWMRQEALIDGEDTDADAEQQLPLIGDSLLIAAKPKSLYEGAVAAGSSTDDVFGQLEVLVRGASLGSKQSKEVRLPDCSGSAVFVAHNTAGLHW